MRAEIREMVAQRNGAIVNVVVGKNFPGFTLSSGCYAAKHAVVGLTRATAVDHTPHGIRINAICPDTIGIPQFDARLSVGEAYSAAAPQDFLDGHKQQWDLADIALWLSSAEAGSVTGACLPIDRDVS